MDSNESIVISSGARTPIGHMARSLSSLRAEDLMRMAVNSLIKKSRLPKEAVDGLLIGWVGQSFSAPNIARVTLLNCGLPEKAQAVTVQNNCISSIESIAAAVRFIRCGEGELFIAGGTECMSRMPYTIDGPRSLKELRSFETVKSKWAGLLESSEVAVVDSLEQGLTDPVKKINMAATAEVCAQMYGIPRQAQDDYARESFRRAITGWNAGFYNSHVEKAESQGAVLLEKDEYPFLREDLVTKPQMMGKAPLLFDGPSYHLKNFYADYGQFVEGKKYHEGDKGTVTLFNSCGRSDGAAAVIVSTEKKARELGLEILVKIKGWGFYGNNPAHMGVSPALAAPGALKHAWISFDNRDQIELHEPFAATILSIFKIGKERFGHDWQSKFASGSLNPNGGSLALGHPLGATGTRLMLNLAHALKNNPKGRYGMIAACAGGGMGGAMVVEKAG